MTEHVVDLGGAEVIATTATQYRSGLAIAAGIGWLAGAVSMLIAVGIGSGVLP